MKKYKAIIFDFDGSLLDTLVDLTDAVNDALRQYGFLICCRSCRIMAE